MLGKRDLLERLAQREDALAQRETEIGLLTRRVDELRSKESRMQEELEGYRSRSEAIVNALTEAQQSAARIRQEAEAYKAEVMGGAYEERDAAIKAGEEAVGKSRLEAEDILRAANAQAEDILREANGQAEQIKAQADAYLSDVEQKAGSLKQRLRQAAEEARQQAEAFGSLMEDIDSARLGAISVPEAALPEDYDSPAELMQSIYAIQGRELPAEEGEAEEAAEEEAQAEPQSEQAPEKESDEAEQVEPEELEEAEPAEEQVFSVDEILAGGVAAAEGEEGPARAPFELDSIIDDILRGV